MYNRILVPLDGSKTAEKVLPHVISEAQYHEATVVVIRVIAPLGKSLRGIPNLIEKIDEHLHIVVGEYLVDVCERIRSKGLKVETMLDHGPPALRILEFTQWEECDLIIIGTHGETCALKWRFGSVANYIVRSKIPIPILIIPTWPKENIK